MFSSTVSYWVDRLVFSWFYKPLWRTALFSSSADHIAPSTKPADPPASFLFDPAPAPSSDRSQRRFPLPLRNQNIIQHDRTLMQGGTESTIQQIVKWIYNYMVTGNPRQQCSFVHELHMFCPESVSWKAMHEKHRSLYSFGCSASDGKTH